ncbi:MAG TPA: hypothetical protein VFK35_04610 [Candidatus Limnocylindrales bacterium]|nr:hypothetical protein [Candidatus Limnocylindrales bacterium]
MSASTRTIQQPAFGGSILKAIAMAAVVLTAALAIALGSANLAGTTSVATPGMLPVNLDTDWRVPATRTTPVGGIQGAPGAHWPAAVPAAGFEPGFLVDADQRRQQSHTSSEGGSATRHPGLRAQ